MSITLEEVLSKKFERRIAGATYTCKPLHGGTLGEVSLLSGTAFTSDNRSEGFSIVRKTQKKWERPGDADSWLREYSIYTADISGLFSDDISIPACYYAGLEEDKLQLWLEYIIGTSGEQLTLPMLEQAATKLGQFQGRLYKHPELTEKLTGLSETDFLERESNQWHEQAYSYEFLCSEECNLPEHLKKWIKMNPWNNKKSMEYNYLRMAETGLPEELRQMIIEADDRRSSLFTELGKLPVVFCHRDLWLENIFCNENKTTVIDWDCAGWGYPGEDIASLIADDTETSNLREYFTYLIPAYLDGIGQYMDKPAVTGEMIRRIILLKYGYRILQDFMFTDDKEEREEVIERLRILKELRV